MDTIVRGMLAELGCKQTVVSIPVPRLPILACRYACANCANWCSQDTFVGNMAGLGSGSMAMRISSPPPSPHRAL